LIEHEDVSPRAFKQMSEAELKRRIEWNYGARRCFCRACGDCLSRAMKELQRRGASMRAA
jgi:hypothetical protein